MTEPSCIPFRLHNSHLVPMIIDVLRQRGEDVSEKTVRQIVEGTNEGHTSYETLGLQHKKDKAKITKRDTRDGFDKKDPNESTSAPEADQFIAAVQRHNEARIDQSRPDERTRVAYALWLIYHGNAPLFENGAIQPAYRLEIIKKHGGTTEGIDEFAHDADTVRIRYSAPPQCDSAGYWGYESSTREGYGDAPERGYILDKPDHRDYVIRAFRNPKWRGTTPHYPFNGKQVSDAGKVLRRLVPSHASLTDDEIFAAIRLITTYSEYSGLLATAINNGFIQSVQAHKEPFSSSESTIRYAHGPIDGEPSDTPPQMCTMSQTFDPYFRRLIILHAPAWLIDAYTTSGRLDRELGQALGDRDSKYNYLKFRGWVTSRTEEIFRISRNPELRRLAELLAPGKLARPENLFAQAFYAERGGREKVTPYHRDVMAFFWRHPSYRNNWSMRKVLMGLFLPYQKYRGSDFAIVEEVAAIAKRHKIGFWGADPTFKVLWEANQLSPRHMVADCLTGSQ